MSKAIWITVLVVAALGLVAYLATAATGLLYPID